MRNIIVGFSKPKKANPLSNAIMWFMGTKFSHVYVAFISNSISRTLIYQANRHGCHFIGKEKFSEDNQVVEYFLLSITEEQYRHCIQKAVDLAGTEYGTMQLIGIGLEISMRKIGIKDAKNPIPDNHRYVCSELVAVILKDCLGYQIDTPLEQITPDDIYKLIKYKKK